MNAEDVTIAQREDREEDSLSKDNGVDAGEEDVFNSLVIILRLSTN